MVPVEHRENMAAIVAALAERHEPSTAREIVSRTGLDREDVELALGDLLGQGVVRSAVLVDGEPHVFMLSSVAHVTAGLFQVAA